MNVFINDSKIKDVYIKGMDVDLHMLVKGNENGIPLIFIPGITSYSYSFLDVLNRISDDYYCLSLDVRGRGQSSWPTTGYKLRDYAEDLLSVVNYIISNPIKPILVGHSMGARIAAAFTSMYPNLVSGSVLIDPPINGPGQRSEYPNPLEEMFLVQKKAVDEGKLDLFASLMPDSWSDKQISQRAEEYRNCSEEAIVESYYSLLYEPFHAHLKNSSIPMLLMAAEFGDTIRENELELIKNTNSYIETQRVKGVAHMIYKEDPDTVVQSIYNFTNKVVK